MKILLICFALLYTNITLSAFQVNTSNQTVIMYKYGIHEIKKETIIKTLRYNVQSYIDHKVAQGWTFNQVTEFKNAYTKYINALSDPNDPYRFYTNDFGSLMDSKGELNNVDSDDFWYDQKGNAITGYEYLKLSEKKKRKYKCFYANREFVTYFNEIVEAIIVEIKKEEKTNKKYVQQNNNNNNCDSDYVGW